MYKQIRTNTAEVGDKVLFKKGDDLVQGTISLVERFSVKIVHDNADGPFTLLGDEGFVWLVERPFVLPTGVGAVVSVDGKWYLNTFGARFTYPWIPVHAEGAVLSDEEFKEVIAKADKVEVLSRGV